MTPMFGRDNIFQCKLQHLAEEELDHAATSTRLQVFPYQRGPAVREVMSVTIRNLAIV